MRSYKRKLKVDLTTLSTEAHNEFNILTSDLMAKTFHEIKTAPQLPRELDIAGITLKSFIRLDGISVKKNVAVVSYTGA